MIGLEELLSIHVKDGQTEIKVRNPDEFYSKLKLPRNNNNCLPYHVQLLISMRDDYVARCNLETDISNNFIFSPDYQLDLEVNNLLALDLTDYIREHYRA
jgi:hypothetical protein